MVRSVLVILYLANGLLAVVNGRHFERCELAEELVKNLKIPESQINDCKTTTSPNIISTTWYD